MSETHVRPATRSDFSVLADIWERAVRASHAFLTEEDIAGIRPEMTAALPAVEILIAERDGEPAGFIGTDGNKIEMLFVDPARKGSGLGTALLRRVRETRSGEVLRLDVNEQNPAALAFYLSRGFRVEGRSELDGAGRPFPLLHLVIGPE